VPNQLSDAWWSLAAPEGAVFGPHLPPWGLDGGHTQLLLRATGLLSITRPEVLPLAAHLFPRAMAGHLVDGIVLEMLGVTLPAVAVTMLFCV
jgi:hypothetical protein